MVNSDDPPRRRDLLRTPRRRDVLRTGAAAGLIGLSGLSVDGALAGTTQQGGAGRFSFSLQEGDNFRIRYRPRTPDGTPATESVPAACLGGDQPEEYQLYIVDAYRDGTNIGYRGLLAPQEAVATETGETTAMDGNGETTAMEEEETTAAAETTMAADATLQLGEWYRVASSEECDGLYALTLEPGQPPETTTP